MTIKFSCLYCGTIADKGKNCFGKYCNNKCQGLHKRQTLVESWLAGELPGWTGKTRQLCNFIKIYLKSTRGSACSICGWDKRHNIDGNSLTEIDHIDGDAENCRPENLRVICPNCHSETDTFRARNKVSKRVRN